VYTTCPNNSWIGVVSGALLLG